MDPLDGLKPYPPPPSSLSETLGSFANVRTAVAISCIFSLLVIFSELRSSNVRLLDIEWDTFRLFSSGGSQSISQPVGTWSTCIGPRGLALNESVHDQLSSTITPGRDWLDPVYGSYEEVGLEKTWMTASQRYGPYGYGDNETSTSTQRVDWIHKVNWASLQNECIIKNEVHFPSPYKFDATPRFRYKSNSSAEWTPIAAEHGTKLRPRDINKFGGRTAIVVRGRSDFNWTAEDHHVFRALISETSLAMSGKYAVVLLVDVKTQNLSIHTNARAYHDMLIKSVPAEFRDMAILWDDQLLRSWYPAIDEHETVWQVMQPFQLFAEFYPEFDHYWQIEMDTRFTGHVGDFLESMTTWARAQPRKQALERGTWYYLPEIHGTYTNLLETINSTINWTSKVWGPAHAIPRGIEAIGPQPPVDSALHENFEWGVGEEADLISLGVIMADLLHEEWWAHGWNRGIPENFKYRSWTTTPAQGRASWNLLHAIHHAQAVHGIALPSESTLPTFALWHGLKIAVPPLPIYMDPVRDVHELDYAVNGRAINESETGMALGPVVYHPELFGFFIGGKSWHWKSTLPNWMYDIWYDGNRTAALPISLRTFDDGTQRKGSTHMADQVFAPNLMLHPRKTILNR